MNKSVSRFVIIVIISVIVVIAVIISFKYDYENNGNFVTMLSVLWSAIATALLGIIALWQNHLYKQQSDKYNEKLEELQNMPELLVELIETYDHLFKGGKITSEMYCKLTDNGGPVLYVMLRTVNQPVLKFSFDSVVAVYNDNEITVFEPPMGLLRNVVAILKDERISFNFQIKPHDIAQYYKLNMSYENIYGDKYMKTIKIVIYKNDIGQYHIRDIIPQKAARVKSK